ncbi:hypothetical protein ACIB24_12540 [Spongisporangium articulatum]|uniref:Uncharacterized protein n=1 Tax=Spongisporangium articulatum TaxID=3362603 RepID=A0ABW8ANG4_9ACTN
MTPAGKRAVWVSDLPDRVVREAVRALEICADEVEPHVIHGPLISRAERLAYAGIETSRGDDEQSLRWTAGSRSAVGERHQIEARQRRTAWAVAELRSEP